MPDVHPMPTGRQFINYTGKKVGRMSVISYAGKRNGKCMWNCLCECGAEWITQSCNIPRTNSCGCLWRDRMEEVFVKHGNGRVGQHTPEYKIWQSMRARCNNPNTPRYERYGGRGITICERWNDFNNFLADMGERPSPKHSIDRYPNQNGNYEPGNCRWATNIEQMRNTSRNHYITFHGVTKCLQEWSNEFDIGRHALKRIIEKSPDMDVAFRNILIWKSRRKSSH